MATVKVEHPVVEGNELGYVVIEEENFDPKVHKVFVEPEPVKTAAEKTLDELNGNELKAYLAEKGVQFPGNISKADALALAKQTEADLAAAAAAGGNSEPAA
jgi:hypothetical protein